MKTVNLGKTGIKVSAIAVGCMRLGAIKEKEVQELVDTALEYGINFIDHADIYGDGYSEQLFGKAVMSASDRDSFFIQSKCGIVQGKMYDLSKEHIITSVEGSLKRLKVQYLDSLLLHRPDALIEPEEVVEAFDILEASGKVKHFGVSNMKPMQIELLKKYVKQPITTNQLQLSVTESNMIRQGMEVNMGGEGATDRDGSILDYCRINDIMISTWSPYQYGYFQGTFLKNEKFMELNNVLDEVAANYNVTSQTIVAAWILRHPAKMQMISGTTNKERLIQIARAMDIELSREEWYKIYLAAGHILP